MSVTGRTARRPKAAPRTRVQDCTRCLTRLVERPMRLVRVHRPGNVSRLAIEEAPDPVPLSSEVLVDVRASGVNFADLVVRMGLYRSAREYVGWPITPGFEVSGVVTAVGDDVRAFRTGDRVLGVTRFGGYANRICLPETQVVRMPEALSFADAAAFPVVFLTAWYALSDQCRLRAGENVLVHSAAGGVGGALVQLARRAGLRSVAVVGASHKVDSVKALGADVVIDKSRGALWPAIERAAPHGFHAVFDANGAETLRQSFAHLRSRGRLVVYGFHTMLKRGSDRLPLFRAGFGWLSTPRFSPLAMTDENKGVVAFNLSYLFDELALFQPAIVELVEALGRGELVKPKVTEVPFADVREAHRLLHSGTTVGKVVLTL
jgi:NADPH:quinone reductase-like Zn-dependent oxidoreductase